jgi:hypothetical protein
MPKNKTHSGAKKRFKVTGSGKLLADGAEVRCCVRVGADDRQPQEAPPEERNRRGRPGRREGRQEAPGSLKTLPIITQNVCKE